MARDVLCNTMVWFRVSQEKNSSNSGRLAVCISSHRSCPALSRSAADAVDEQLRGGRKGVVDHVVEEGDVDSTGRDIGHDEKLRLHRVGQEGEGGIDRRFIIS